MKIKIGDIIVLVVVLSITAMTFIVNVERSFVSKDMEVVVRVNGEVIDQFDIGSDIKKVYETEQGLNELIINSGKAYISDADCPDLICVNTRHAEKNGDSVVCLPNRFSIEIVGRSEGEVDAISQ